MFLDIEGADVSLPCECVRFGGAEGLDQRCLCGKERLGFAAVSFLKK